MKKGSIKINTKTSLILRIDDIIEPLPDFFARPAKLPNLASGCEFDKLLSGNLQILKKTTHFV